jgi:hypothetical protein
MHRYAIAIAVFFISACGGTSISAADFIGNWNRSGNNTVTCAGTPNTTSITGVLTIVAGSSSNQIQGTQPDGCQTNYTISGAVATAAAGQSCTVAVTGGSWLVTIQSHTLTFSGDGTTGSTLAEASSSTVVETVSGTTSNCTESSTGTFTKQ